jgi:hypothetical protein
VQCIVTDTTGMYLYVSKISSEIQILNFVYLRFSHCIYVSKDVRVGPWLLLEAKRGQRTKHAGKH